MFCIIPARGNSKRIPKKNICELNGKPLLSYTIEAAKKFELFGDNIHVSSENDEILEVASKCGASPYWRDPKLSDDKTRYFDVVKDFLIAHDVKEEPFCVLLPTSPLRNEQDISSAYNIFYQNQDKADGVMSVSELNHLPFHSLVVQDKLIKPLDAHGQTLRRQDIRTYYRHDGSLIIAKTERFLECNDWWELNLVPYHTPKSRALDIDTPEDLELAEMILSKV